MNSFKFIILIELSLSLCLVYGIIAVHTLHWLQTISWSLGTSLPGALNTSTAHNVATPS